MNRPYKRNERKVKSRLLFFLIAPMLLIPLSAFGYAQWNDTLTATAYLASGDEDIRITNYEVAYYNGQGIDITIATDEKSIAIEDTLLFPEWELKLAIEIHNAGDLPLYLRSEIQHEDGTPLNETQLLDLFRIKYTDGFYLNPGSDGQWFTEDDEPVPDLTNSQLWVDDNWYKLEHLIFDAQGFPELQDQSFAFQVIISGTFIGGP